MWCSPISLSLLLPSLLLELNCQIKHENQYHKVVHSFSLLCFMDCSIISKWSIFSKLFVLGWDSGQFSFSFHFFSCSGYAAFPTPFIKKTFFLSSALYTTFIMSIYLKVQFYSFILFPSVSVTAFISIPHFLFCFSTAWL